MAGFIPAIHGLLCRCAVKEDVDARHKAGHDVERLCAGWTGLEIQREAALDGVALRMRGKLALVEGAELGPRRDAPVETGFDLRRVARDRNAGNRERRAGALEGER